MIDSSTLKCPQIVTFNMYFKGRDRFYPDAISDTIINNARELLSRVNALLDEIKITRVYVSSGWRPPQINDQVGGRPLSHHISGKAIDISDPTKSIANLIQENPELLVKHQLWMESPKKTSNWVHLDIGDRPDRLIRIFEP